MKLLTSIFCFFCLFLNAQDEYSFNSEYTYELKTEYTSEYNSIQKIYLNNKNSNYVMYEKSINLNRKKDLNYFLFDFYDANSNYSFSSNPTLNTLESNNHKDLLYYNDNYKGSYPEKYVFDLLKIDNKNYKLIIYKNGKRKKVESRRLIEIDPNGLDNFKHVLTFFTEINSPVDLPKGEILKITWFRKNKKTPNYMFALVGKKKVDLIIEKPNKFIQL